MKPFQRAQSWHPSQIWVLLSPFLDRNIASKLGVKNLFLNVTRAERRPSVGNWISRWKEQIQAVCASVYVPLRDGARTRVD